MLSFPFSWTAVGLAALLAASACACPRGPRDLADAGFATPQATVRSYQSFMAYDLRDWEYRCFSQGFRARNQLSFASYAEGRDRLLARQPWLKSIAGARLLGDRPGSSGEHWVDLRVLGRTVHVRLVREEFFEIRSSEGLLADGDGRLVDWLSVEELAPAGSVLHARAPTPRPAQALAQASEVRFAREWKIDDFVAGSTPPQP
jgi:hypothetical protein